MNDNKEILIENLTKNSLGITISKPSQVLYVMSGLPGSGKSTKAKSLVGGGIIHSTDDLVEATGDYIGFFTQMISTGDFTPLSNMHSKNLKNAVESMKNGINTIIIDNTNLRPNEAKPYVVSALEIGYADSNIKFIDIGTGDSTAEELASRNKHGVPLEKIKSMVQTYYSFKPLTLEKVLASKDIYKSSNILYSAVVLDNESKIKLFDIIDYKVPKGFISFGNHMTIVFGKGVKNKEDIGKEVSLTVTHIGSTDMTIAVRVEGYESNNDIPHITIAVNPEGGKPVMSKNITNWTPIKSFVLNGIVTEITKSK